MKVEEIIEGLNRYIEHERSTIGLNQKGHFVLQKIIKPHHTFKAYKEYTYSLWYIKNRDKHNIITIHNTEKVLNNQEDNILRKMNIDLCINLIKIIHNSNTLDLIIKGEYAGDKI